METRANFILIGAFTLLAILGTLGFFIWLASVQVDRQYITYGILFRRCVGAGPVGRRAVQRHLGRQGHRAAHLRAGPVQGLRRPSRSTQHAGAHQHRRAVAVAGRDRCAYISLSGGTPGAAAADGKGRRIADHPLRAGPRCRHWSRTRPICWLEATDLLAQFQATDRPGKPGARHAASCAISRPRRGGWIRRSPTFPRSLARSARPRRRSRSSPASWTASARPSRPRWNGPMRRCSLPRPRSTAADTTLVASGAAIRNVEDTFDAAQILLRDTVPPILAQLFEAVTRADTAIADLQQRGGDHARRVRRDGGSAERTADRVGANAA